LWFIAWLGSNCVAKGWFYFFPTNFGYHFFLRNNKFSWNILQILEGYTRNEMETWFQMLQNGSKIGKLKLQHGWKINYKVRNNLIEEGDQVAQGKHPQHLFSFTNFLSISTIFFCHCPKCEYDLDDRDQLWLNENLN
jgi:hypothetical protein